jgi:hypothetical protein
MAEKLDFLMCIDGQPEAVKARVFTNETGAAVARISGGIFNGYEIEQEQLRAAIRILKDVLQSSERDRLDGCRGIGAKP